MNTESKQLTDRMLAFYRSGLLHLDVRTPANMAEDTDLCFNSTIDDAAKRIISQGFMDRHLK